MDHNPNSPYRPEPRHIEIGESLYDVVAPAAFPSHILRFRNQRAAEAVGLGGLDDEAWVNHFARFSPLPRNLPVPLALRYHGHQFRHYNPDLGDGRGFLFAQLRSGVRLLDLGTKGSGTTPWSRGGDGRLTLQGGVREVLAAEQQEALGVPTCRIFSLIETGEALDRHDEDSPTRGAVMVRLQHSHIRIGTFQRLAHTGDLGTLKRLVEHCLELHHPFAEGPAGLLAAARRAMARTCGAWMAAGYVHGVLNTDNLNITGESFDFGPWRFLPFLDPNFTAAYFDHNGLYAYGRQPEAVAWNLRQLTLALSEIERAEPLAAALQGFDTDLDEALRRQLLWRLGLQATGTPADGRLVEILLKTLTESRLRFDRFFFDWYGGASARALSGPFGGLYQRRWFSSLRSAIEAQPVRPDLQPMPDQPCEMLIDEVRAIWANIAQADDWSSFYNKLAAVRNLGRTLGTSPCAAAAHAGHLGAPGALDPRIE